MDTVVRRVDFGYFIRPAEETDAGVPRAEPCLGYLVAHARGLVLMDTGMGSHPDADAHYKPNRRPLPMALAAHGFGVDDVTVVTNCHLHFDHCGGNPELRGRPIFAQRTELETALSTPRYTLPELVEIPCYELCDGRTEILPGVTIVPTPGHTAGHQSLVVRQRDGTLVVAGQSHPSASAYAADLLALQAQRLPTPSPLPPPPAWMGLLADMDPRRVVFAHDHAVWEP